MFAHEELQAEYFARFDDVRERYAAELADLEQFDIAEAAMASEDQHEAAWWAARLSDIRATPPCFACQVDERMARGEDVPPGDTARWAMWGCTCTPEAEQDALAYINHITH